MAPKKTAFSVFLFCHRSDEIDKGKKASSFKELTTKLLPIWKVSSL